MNEHYSKNNLGRYFGGIVSLLIIGASIVGVTHRQQILDFLALRNYTPSQRIVDLATQTTMRDDMRRVFYVNHPELNDKAAFRNNCPSGEQSIVLGCFVERQGIFLLDVSDQRLSGIIQVTAAHETLHAEYARLSSSERQKVDTMTSDFFATHNDARIKKTIESYRAKDPSVVPNELHSILGTEVRNLSPELEAYYSQYFTDRSKIIDFSEKYEQTFVDLNNQVDDYDRRLETLKERINTNQNRIESSGSAVEASKRRLDSLLSSGNNDEYNAAVPGFNQQVQQYNSLVNTTKQQIDEYNELVEKRNSIATTEAQLVESLNSNITTKQTE